MSDVKSAEPLQFSVIVDGTRDISGSEQESVCIRYVDNELTPHDIFIGMYAVTDTSGDFLCRMLYDVLLRHNLPLSSLRGQTYDGASAMAGQYKGCQALMRQRSPLVIYVHCGAHCVNLVMEKVVDCTPQFRDAIQWVHELGTLTT